MNIVFLGNTILPILYAYYCHNTLPYIFYLHEKNAHGSVIIEYLSYLNRCDTFLEIQPYFRTCDLVANSFLDRKRKINTLQLAVPLTMLLHTI
jgi:hypothetical protein